MMLPDPGLVVSQPVEDSDQLQIPVQRVVGILDDAMKRGEEDAEVQPIGSAHGQVLTGETRPRQGGAAARAPRRRALLPPAESATEVRAGHDPPSTGLAVARCD